MPFQFLRALASVLAVALGGQSLPAEPIRVFAAASLTDALEEMGNLARQSEIEISVNLAGSNTLVRQILEGARADLIITADEVSMNRLLEGGRVQEGDIKSLLLNHLVIVAPLDVPSLNQLGELVQPRFRKIAVADEATAPAGLYARKALDAVGLWESLKPRIVPTENVRGALAAVESGNAQAAVVYRTDAAISSKSHIIWQFEGQYAPRIAYPAAIAKAAPNREGAERFLALMISPKGRAVFEKFGFEILDAGER